MTKRNMTKPIDLLFIRGILNFQESCSLICQGHLVQYSKTRILPTLPDIEFGMESQVSQ